MAVSITFSHDDTVSARWTGVGRPLTFQEVNLDLYNLKTAVELLQDNYSATISISTITQPAFNTMRVTLTDASFYDLTLPIGRWRSRGEWQVSTAYLVDDIFNAPDGGLYQTIFDHTSDDTEFDPNANDGLGHDYYFALIPARGNALPSGGAVGMYIRKNSSTEYDFGLAYIQATEVQFDASTASALISDNVAAALEELEALIGDIATDLTVDAADVTFTPSTGSILTADNVADALEELEANISAPVGYLPLSGGTMTGALTLVGNPASAFQAATKQYVDGIALNLGKRQTVRVATTANIVISSSLNSGDTIDGVTLATSDLVLVKNQTTAAQNGVYVVDVSPVRSVEFDTFDEHPGALIVVQEGTAGADSVWLCTANAGGTLNTTPITFSQSSTSGALLAANNLSDIPSPTAARANLGIIEDLAGLSDVNVTEGAGIDGYTLTWDNGTGFWVATLAGGATYFAGTGLDLTGTTFSVKIGTDVQAYDPQLSSLVRQNSQSTAYTTVLADGGKHILHPTADNNARTFTIDSNANVAYPIGTAITFINEINTVTIAITSDTLKLAGTGATGSRTLAANGMATAIKTDTATWWISGTGLT